ncbi:MAG: fatty acid--CoA ligase family protein [Verrucomicrobia bacterium]|nr:fatty acid--CoA ligase family protein [Verrucomicrobiota bacterium]
MLYGRWRQIARERGHGIALRDLAAGRQWSFAELAALAEAGPAAAGPVVYPQGHCAGFIFDVLRGWRGNAVVCPLEPDQDPPRMPPLPTPCCHLKTTSATGGLPRGVAFRAEQLAADADNIVATMGLRADWPNLGVISLAHSYGFSNLVLPLLLHGIPLILAPSPLPEMVRRAAEGYPDLTLAGVPALWRAWHEARVIPPDVRLAISAGAPLPLALERAVFDVAGLKIHNFYGSSECGGIAYDGTCTPRPDDSSVGSPMHHVDVALCEDGCLQVRSRAVGETYWPDGDDTLAAGCFQTSDLAELRDGQVYLRGRLGDQINVAGRKVSPATIERALREHEAVKDCLVFGIPSSDADRTDAIIACVATDGPGDSNEMKQFLLSKLPGWQIPRGWWFVESLGVNTRGKTPRAEWRRKYLGQRPPDPLPR